MLDKRPDFELNATMAFVTYTHSQVDDKEEFHKHLRDSLEKSLPRVSATERVAVEIFGRKELHEDGTPHYHVVLKFSKRVHWRKAREKLAVWIVVDGRRVIDTESIYIRKKSEWETGVKFLQSVQAYVAKGGNVFGQWIGEKQPTAKEKDKHWTQTVECERVDEAVVLIKEHYPSRWVNGQASCQAFLRTKKPPPLQQYVPGFEVKPWRVPPQILQWRQRNFPVRGSGRPTSLVIIGPSGCGKTEWASSFGKPAIMYGRWVIDQLLAEDSTHLVLNDMPIRSFPNKYDLAGCQEFLDVTGKNRRRRTISWNKPVIWTCGEGNSVLKDKKLAKHFADCGAVIVHLRPNCKLYKDE